MNEHKVGQICVQTNKKCIFEEVGSYFHRKGQSMKYSWKVKNEVLADIFFGHYNIVLLLIAKNDAFENIWSIENDSFQAAFNWRVSLKTGMICNLVRNADCNRWKRNTIGLSCRFHNHHLLLCKPDNSRHSKEIEKYKKESKMNKHPGSLWYDRPQTPCPNHASHFQNELHNVVFRGRPLT